MFLVIHIESNAALRYPSQGFDLVSLRIANASTLPIQKFTVPTVLSTSCRFKFATLPSLCRLGINLPVIRPGSRDYSWRFLLQYYELLARDDSPRTLASLFFRILCRKLILKRSCAPDEQRSSPFKVTYSVTGLSLGFLKRHPRSSN